MEPELDEKAGVLELQVRMDCNGCVQRIKRVLHGIDGVQSIYVDLACQKLTVVGAADPEKIVKAIKKTRKNATISSRKEPAAEQPPPPPPEEQPPSSDPPPASDAAAEAPPPPEPPKDDAAPPQDGASPEPEAKPSPEAEEERIPMVHNYPHYDNYVPREQWSYNNYYYLPHRQERIMYEHAGDGYGRNMQYQYYAAAEGYDGDGNHHHSRRDGNQMDNLFSDENPNACRIV